jgi:hypothetical protein
MVRLVRLVLLVVLLGPRAARCAEFPVCTHRKFSTPGPN